METNLKEKNATLRFAVSIKGLPLLETYFSQIFFREKKIMTNYSLRTVQKLSHFSKD